MSADNGVYILKTDGPQYRVKHLQAIENVHFDDELGDFTEDSNIHILNARRMWKGCTVFDNDLEAMQKARDIYTRILESDCPICEYGISFIAIKEKF
ncbi:MAG: hypothetical protein ACTSPB_04140 [Candidatus Thorarchaeota archaeon]